MRIFPRLRAFLEGHFKCDLLIFRRFSAPLESFLEVCKITALVGYAIFLFSHLKLMLGRCNIQGDSHEFSHQQCYPFSAEWQLCNKGVWNSHPWYKVQITSSLLLAVSSQINRNSWDLKIKSCRTFFFHSGFIDKFIILLHHFSKFRWKSINIDIWKWIC